MTISNRLGISSNLPTGATNDLLLLTYADGFPEGQISFNIEITPRKVTGVQKVAQTFLKLLLTTKGSNILRQSEGTYFPNYVIGANRTGVDSELYSVILTAITDAESQVKYILNNDTSTTADLTSQLSKVKVLGINLQEDRLTMFLQITTNAGVSAQVAIPFPQLDLELSNA